jgi:hypothetical protein
MPQATKIVCEVPEFEKYERSFLWYIAAIVVGIALLAYAVLTSNFLFAIILVLISVIAVLMSFREPKMIKLEIDPTGVRLGTKKFGYNQFKQFSIVYQPPHINTLYLEFRMPLRERISLPMGEIDPNAVRNYLINFIEEDLEREEESLTDVLSRILKF